jgi:hypothetical protein
MPWNRYPKGDMPKGRRHRSGSSQLQENLAVVYPSDPAFRLIPLTVKTGHHGSGIDSKNIDQVMGLPVGERHYRSIPHLHGQITSDPGRHPTTSVDPMA